MSVTVRSRHAQESGDGSTSAADVPEYIERDSTAECERIGHRIAARVAEMLENLEPTAPPRSGVSRGRTRKAGR